VSVRERADRPQIVSHENALKWIAYIAWVHYSGGAFDPQHMKSIQWLAADALAGKPMVDYDVSMSESRKEGERRWKEIQQYID
jgi:hypothetical protein